MGDLATTCKDKLAYFRIKELKDVLIRLALPKHGKKQELVDRILALLAEDQGQWHFGRGKKNAPSKETVAGVVDDIYRKMQVHGPPELLLQRPVATDFSYLKRPKEQERPCQPDANKSHCVCGQTFLLGNVVKCEDCQVQQHTDCVLIPEKPIGRPEVPDHFYCQLCRLKRADPYLVTTGNLLLPVRLMFSNVANDGTNVSQCVDKTFLLSRAEREIVQRTEYDIQVWCMLLNDKVQFRMHWPQHAELHVNGILVRVVPRPSSQLLGNNGRDDGPVITTFCQEGQNKIVLSCTDARPFCIGVRIVRKRTVEQNRENDELTRGLGNDEHKRRTQGTPGFKPWTIAFPQDRKKYPDESHQKRKEREAREARVAADRLRNIEETIKRQQDQIDALIQQGTTSQSQRHKVEAELEATGPSSRKSSVASTELQAGDDDALTMAPLRYPVDDITERTPCELHVKVVNITIKVAVGYALRIGPKPTFHCSPVPHGYAVVWVDEVMKGFEELKLDQVMKGFEELKLDHPAGEDRDVTELGEAKKKDHSMAKGIHRASKLDAKAIDSE